MTDINETLQSEGAEGVRQRSDKARKVNGSLDDQKPEPASDELGEWNAGSDPGLIPPRPWLLGYQFCCGFISSVVSAGGVGKSALRLSQYMSLATGRKLSGEHVFRRSRVLPISLEDDDNELQRRIQAVLNHFNIPRSELDGWLYCKHVRRSKIAVLEKRNRIVGPLKQQICNAAARRKIDLVALDPFVKLHSLEENDSGDMNFVCDMLTDIAVDDGIAVDIPHHVHKGTLTPGDADSGRGSSGIRDAGRLISTLSVMSEEEAKAFNISDEERLAYIRLDPAKINIAARSGKATWFHLVGAPLGNGTEMYPNGDSVQVVEPWKPKSIWADLDGAKIDAILREIESGPKPGEYYSAQPSAKDRAAWRVVSDKVPTLSEAQCREVIKAWVKNGLLVGFDYTNRDSKVVKGVKVNETIKDELLGALRGTRAPPSAFSDGGLMADDIFRRDEPSLKENLMAESPPPSGFPDGGRRRADDEEPPYRVLGSAPGERCIGCGSGRDVKRIDYGGAVDPWHEDCVRRRLEAAANPPVTDPDAVVVSVPFLITRETKRRLRAIGYSDAQIADLTPQQALEILAEKDGQST